MAKIKSRIRSLEKRTHSFIAVEDFRVIRDSLETAADSEKTADFEKEYEELLALRSRQDAKSVTRHDEILQSSRAVWMKSLSEQAAEDCAACPNGTWMENPTGEKILKFAKAGREYLARTRAGKKSAYIIPR